jgi:hypothetical protein
MLSYDDNIMGVAPMSRCDELALGLESLLELDGEIIVDNAHSVKKKRRAFAAKTITWDHRHIRGRVVSYKYMNAEKLMVDFWNDVDRVLSEMDR